MLPTFRNYVVQSANHDNDSNTNPTKESLLEIVNAPSCSSPLLQNFSTPPVPHILATHLLIHFMEPSYAPFEYRWDASKTFTLTLNPKSKLDKLEPELRLMRAQVGGFGTRDEAVPDDI